MINLTPKLLAEATGCSQAKAEVWFSPIQQTLECYGINRYLRAAAFLAQIAHESGRFFWVREIWGPTPAQQRYEGREDLGNTKQGDGFRFRGRGLIQVTGRANYRRMGRSLGLPLEESPELLEVPFHAAMSAGQFWEWHQLNALADCGEPCFCQITRIINGGQNGAAERRALYERALRALG